MKAASDITHSQHDNTPDFRALSAESGIIMAAFFQAMQETDALIQQQEQTLLERVGKSWKGLEKDDIINKKDSVIDEQKKRIAVLESYLRLARSQLFGRSSEKSNGQWDIFNGLETPEPDEEEVSGEDPLHLPRRIRKVASPCHQVLITLPDDEKPGAINTFFTKVREELDIIPPVVRVLEIMQEKAIFPANPKQGGPQRVKAAVLPKHPIPKSAVSVAMLAWIIIARFCDALPLYRQEKILDRDGGSITRTTMANWLIRLAR